MARRPSGGGTGGGGGAGGAGGLFSAAATDLPAPPVVSARLGRLEPRGLTAPQASAPTTSALPERLAAQVDPAVAVAVAVAGVDDLFGSGGGGGGGGSGGNGGNGGNLGTAAGGSFALYAYNSTVTVSSSTSHCWQTVGTVERAVQRVPVVQPEVEEVGLVPPQEMAVPEAPAVSAVLVVSEAAAQEARASAC